MSRIIFPLSAITMALVNPLVYAEEPEPWKGEVELGVVITSGNTETENINGKVKIINQRITWRHTGRIETYSSSDTGITTAERYLVSLKSDYKISGLSYLFVLLNYEDDRFSGYDYQSSESMGYGRTIIKKDNLTLDLEIGAGARQSKVELTGLTEDEGLMRAAGNLAWEISDTTTFTEELFSDVGEDVTISKSVTGLKSQVAGNLATKITYTVKNTSDVPVGIEKTDTETAITLVYSFH